MIPEASEVRDYVSPKAIFSPICCCISGVNLQDRATNSSFLFLLAVNISESYINS